MIKVVARGVPSPQGSKKFIPRKNKATGAITGGNLVDANPEKLATWRETVRSECQRLIETDPSVFPLEGPLVMSVVFTLPRPKSLPKKYTIPEKKPDLDKLLRATLDSLKDGGIYKDDAQVHRLKELAKVFPDPDARPHTSGIWAGMPWRPYNDIISTPGVVIRLMKAEEFYDASS
jgi:Holliday junction resolvase RusA-like endonuclease